MYVEQTEPDSSVRLWSKLNIRSTTSYHESRGQHRPKIIKNVNVHAKWRTISSWFEYFNTSLPKCFPCFVVWDFFIKFLHERRDAIAEHIGSYSSNSCSLSVWNLHLTTARSDGKWGILRPWFQPPISINFSTMLISVNPASINNCLKCSIFGCGVFLLSIILNTYSRNFVAY